MMRSFLPNIRTIDRTSFPSPIGYLKRSGLIKAKPIGDWATIKCPVHKAGSERKPSMRVNLMDGHFRCMACGAKGGDIIALHRLRTGQKFQDAVIDLGGRFHG